MHTRQEAVTPVNSQLHRFTESRIKSAYIYGNLDGENKGKLLMRPTVFTYITMLS